MMPPLPLGAGLHPLLLHQLHHLLQMITSTYHVDEMLHAWHVQVLRDHPEIARDPAMERFSRAAAAALHAKVALAGLIKRVLLCDMPHEAMRLLDDQLRAWQAEHARAAAAFRELAAKPEAARLRALQAMRYLMAVSQRATRTLLRVGGQALGVKVEALAVEPWEASSAGQVE